MSYRGPARAFKDGRHVGPGPWLDVIHECNRIYDERNLDDPDRLLEPFGSPESTGPWWAGGYVEEYHAFRVLHREDDSVSIIPKTPGAAALLKVAVERLANT